MGADYNDILAKLQIQASQPVQPSFMGLSAPQDPSTLQAVLAKLQQQQYVQQQGHTPGQFGYLHDAGQQAFANVGQQLGNAIGNAGTPQAPQQTPGPAYTPPAPDAKGADAIPMPLPGGTPQQSVSNMVKAAQAYYSSQVNGGVDPDQAKVNTAKAMVKWGAPGADTILDSANEQLKKNQKLADESFKDRWQGNAFKDEIDHRALDDKSKVFTPRPDLSNTEYMAQQDANGRIYYEKRGDKLPPPPMTPAQDANMDATIDMVGTNKISIADALSRAPAAQRQEFLARLSAKYPDYNTPGFKAKTEIVKAYTSGNQGQAAIKMENAAQHSDMVDQAGLALSQNDLPKLNKIANALGVETGSLTTPKAVYDAILPIYAAEVNSSLVKGGGGEAEREARIKALSSDLPQESRHAALMGIQGMLKAQAGNMAATYHKASGNHDFYDLYPGLAPTSPQVPQAAPPPQAPQAPQQPPDLVSAAQAELARRVNGSK